MANRKSDERKKQLDVSNRNRDELGRFAKTAELKLPSDRPIKLVRIRGSYKSYEVRERWFTDEERALIYGMLALLGWLFIL